MKFLYLSKVLLSRMPIKQSTFRIISPMSFNRSSYIQVSLKVMARHNLIFFIPLARAVSLQLFLYCVSFDQKQNLHTPRRAVFRSFVFVLFSGIFDMLSRMHFNGLFSLLAQLFFSGCVDER